MQFNNGADLINMSFGSYLNQHLFGGVRWT